MCQATDSADSSKLKCFLCSIHQHICDHTLCYISGLLRIPRLPLPPLQTKLLSRWTDKRDWPTATSATEGPAGSGKSSGLAQRGDVLLVATMVSAGGFLKSPSKSLELMAPAGPRPRVMPQLCEDGILLGAPPPKGTRAALAHRATVYTLLVLTWALWKQTTSWKEAGGDDKVLSPLCVTAWGCPPHTAYGSSWARST